MDKYFKDAAGNYYDRAQGWRVASHSETGEQLVIASSVCENYEDERLFAIPLSRWEASVAPVTEEDMFLVQKFNLECPSCGQGQALGYYSTREKAEEAIRGQGECTRCYEVEVDDNSRGRKASRWVREESYKVIKPLAALHLEHVQ